jgi:predicted alpha/beta-hydrolase family hydrolase
MTTAAPVTIPTPAGPVSGLLDAADTPSFVYVLAHGAGAGMRHPFLADCAALLATRGAATLRYQLPYMEAGRSRVDSPEVSARAVRAAVARAGELLPGVPIIAGGKSFGGRMTSEAQAREPLPGTLGLAFLGFPLHPPDTPGITRAAHLDSITIPMLFLQGTRDEFAQLDLLRSVVARQQRATLVLTEDGDHSFNARLKYGGQPKSQVMAALADQLVQWARGLRA